MSTALYWPFKDPQEVLDYVIDWSQRLAQGDTISTSSWAVSPAGMNITNTGRGNDSTTIWLSGGSIGTTYSVTNTITTAEGRTMEQTVYLSVQSK